jgi:CheY-like chemotaxis protein
MNQKGAFRILVTEDDRFALEFLAKAIEKEGSTVQRAWSGAEALDVLSSQPLDLVLTDLRMCCPEPD